MTNTTNNPWEQLFRQMGKEFARQAKEAFIGTVSSVSTSGIGLTIDGDDTGTKKYTCARSERFASGDRVLVVRVSGTYVAVCKVGTPGGPTAATLSMTQPVGADSSGALWTEPLAVATASKLGGVKPVAKTNAMTQDVGVDSSGALWTAPFALEVASSSKLGGVKPASKTTAMTQSVGVDSAGALWTAPLSLEVATSSKLGGVKPASKTTAMTQSVGVDSSGALWTEVLTLEEASTSKLGGIKTAEAYSSSKHTLKTAVNSSGVLYVEGPGSFDLPTASTTTLGGVKTSATYSSSTHTVKIAANSSGVLYAEASEGSNTNRIYAGTSTTNYIELNSSKELKPTGTGFNIGSSVYPFAEVYMGGYTSSTPHLVVSKGSIIPSKTYTVSGYLDLGSSIYPFNRLYVKELYINGTKFTPS